MLRPGFASATGGQRHSVLHQLTCVSEPGGMRRSSVAPSEVDYALAAIAPHIPQILVGEAH
jgi:hypothetical protein